MLTKVGNKGRILRGLVDDNGTRIADEQAELNCKHILLTTLGTRLKHKSQLGTNT